MLLLTATTDKLQLVTSIAADVDVHASVMDHTLSTDNVEGVKQNTAITTATTTDIVASPASGVVRNVKTLHIQNKDTADTTDVTILYDQNATDFQMFKATLAPGDTLEYIEGVGFFKTTSSVALLDRTLRVTANRVNATTSFADIADLAWPVIAGKHYTILMNFYITNDAATTGSRFGIGGVAMTAMRLGEIGVNVNSVGTADEAEFQTGALATAVDVSPSGNTTIGSTAAHISIISGWFNPSASGTLACRFQSEVAVANGVTVLQGSWARVTETYN